MATVLTGGRRFAHLERLRGDAVVQAILGVTRMPSAMTLRVTSATGAQPDRTSVRGARAICVTRVARAALDAVLDLDSTVFERYGRQQGGLKGYNPRKHERQVAPGNLTPRRSQIPDVNLSIHPARAHRMKTAAFRQAQSVPPFPVDLSTPTSVTCPPSLHGHYPASSLIRSSPAPGWRIGAFSSGFCLCLFP